MTGKEVVNFRGIKGLGIPYIHRPYFLNAPTGTKSAEQIENNYQSVLDVMRSYLGEMNVDVRLADQMLRIDPDRVRYLTRAELDDFGIGEGQPPVDVETEAKMKEAVALKAAMAYGLSRLEYMRRDNLVDKTCQLGAYQNPDEPPDFASYGRTSVELKMSPDELLKADFKREEDGWSRCYKHIMTYGR